MKPPKTPFWAFNDIGDGPQWYLCQISGGTSDKPMLKYLTADFEDFWHDDDWSEEEIIAIEKPEPLEDWQ